jgi:hypothetical protein
MKYTESQLDQHALADLLADANAAKRQVSEGIFYPERGITRESLLAYARQCRESAARFANGGAHEAVLAGLL